jgi:CheY-like chemotaxis protein
MARILLIDDDAPFRGMLSQVLEREGHFVVEAEHGREGLERYRESPFDLVITDLLMPEEEGLATIRTLRRVCPTVKIIAMSGGGMTGQLDFLPVAKRLGAHHTLWKPFPRQELLDAVRILVEGQDA